MTAGTAVLGVWILVNVGHLGEDGMAQLDEQQSIL